MEETATSSFENELSKCCTGVLSFLELQIFPITSAGNQFLPKMGVVLIAADNIGFLLGCVS